MKRVPIGTVAACVLAACATAPVDPDAPVVVNGLLLSPYGVHEECRTLVPGDRLDYRFASSAPVSFNIHYHDGNAIVSPITHDGVTADSGIFAPALRQDFCLTWQAQLVTVTLDYRVAVRRKRP
jgi:hypothetical protein